MPQINDLVNAVCDFDLDDDCRIVARAIEDGDINLDSWFAFKGDLLKMRWNECADLINDNKAYMLCTNTCEELINYLRENL
jgi:hypothetical protein